MSISQEDAKKVADQPYSTAFPYCESRNRPADSTVSLTFCAPKHGKCSLRNAFFTVFFRKQENFGSVRGSLSVEAACAFPLFLMVLCALLSFFSVIRTELLLGTAMSDTVRELAGSEDPDFSRKAAAKVLQAFQENGGTEERLGMGMTGLEICADADASGGEARISARYRVAVPFFSRFSLRMPLEISVSGRLWCGKSFAEAADTQLVYVTQYGSVYHTSLSCRYLSPSVTSAGFAEIPGLRNKNGSIYYPCEICGAGPHAEQVYITGYGTRWHSDRNCAGIRRGIRRMTRAEAKDLPLCSYCRERDGE